MNTAILAIVLLVVLFQLYAELIPEAQASGNALNDSNLCGSAGCVYNASNAQVCQVAVGNFAGCGQTATSIPLSSLFAGTGIVFIIIMAALLILVVLAFMPSKGK